MKTDITGYRIYKPTRAKNGTAIQFNPDNNLGYIWLEIAPQLAEKEFDWGKKIIFKLGHDDLLKLIYWMEIVRTERYKDQLAAEAPETFDTWMGDLCRKDKKDPYLLELFHRNHRKNEDAVLTLLPNGAKYGGGFRIRLYKKFADGTNLNYQVAVSTHETLGILYVLEKPLKALGFETGGSGSYESAPS